MPRPVPRFHAFIGQREVIEPLVRQVRGAIARAEPVLHTLFSGPSGVGKTVLARAIAKEIRVDLVEATQKDEASEEKFTELLLRLKHCDTLFIDEAHQLPFPLQELLYKAIDRGLVPNFKRPTEDSSEVVPPEVAIKPFTLILATDQDDKLLNALRKRMVNDITLRYYTVRELKEIVDLLATKLTLLLSPQSAKLMARVSAGLPRMAWHHLQKLRQASLDSENQKIEVSKVRHYLSGWNIDSLGIGPRERQYLQYLAEVKVASLESIALHLGLRPASIKRQSEPLLVRNGFIVIGKGGRQLTPKGCEWLTKKHKSKKQEKRERGNAQGG
jgi:Holliday junction DNA helicase RuvB